jgi:hypothetical protein
MRALVRRDIDLAVPAQVAWAYITDWPKQGEWIPQTRVEVVDAADRVGGRLRAWTGVGRVGFWDPMTITAWEVQPDGTRRCEVLHTGAVLRGEGGFVVQPRSATTCRFVWWERLVVPGGPFAALLWKGGGPVTGAMLGLCLRRLAARLERHAD